MRVAALYDIHGNLPALEAVLAEVDADVLVVGGDFVAGPWPQETYERLRALDGDVRFLRGNADREVVEEEPGLAPPELTAFVRERLSADAVEFLRGMPLTVSVGAVLFCHATPRSDEEILTRVSPDERWRAALDGVAAATVVCGHTHIQFERQFGGVRLVNAGSIGMPYEREPGAYWALLDDGAVSFRRTEYEPGDLSVWPGEWPQASPEEATAFFERLSLEHA